MSDFTVEDATLEINTEVEDLMQKTVRNVVDSVDERMNKELYGAWRAGYEYVHVYKTLNFEGRRMDPFSVGKEIVLSNSEEPPQSNIPAYQHTYDLTDVPAERLREAWRARTGDTDE